MFTLLVCRNVGLTDITKYTVNHTLKIWIKWSGYQFFRAFYLTSHSKKFSTTTGLFGFLQVYCNCVLTVSCRNHLCDARCAGAARDILGKKKKKKKIQITGLAGSLPLRPWNQEFTPKKQTGKNVLFYYFFISSGKNSQPISNSKQKC